MKPFVTSRAIPLLAGALFAVITACSDSGSALGLTGPKAAANNDPRTSGDTAKSGGTHDSTGSHNPSRTPVDKFALTVNVGTPRPGATDTLSTNPVANASVSVYEETLTFVHNPGSDTVHISMDLVGTGTSDANGNVTIAGLKGAGQYNLKIVPPPGSALHATSAWINQAFTDAIKVSIVLR
jgi:hypothetical protein